MNRTTENNVIEMTSQTQTLSVNEPLENEQVWAETAREHEPEIKELDEALLRSKRKEELMRMKEEILQKRQVIYFNNWNERLEQKKRHAK